MLEKENNIKIIVAVHKKVQKEDVIPDNDPDNETYLMPLHVGKQEKKDIGIIGDDTGENISDKNDTYCELTGLYWAWKNLTETEFLGLCHYRRFFSSNYKRNACISGSELLYHLSRYDIILPRKRYYVIQTIEEHYCCSHYQEPLQETRKIIYEYYPEMKDSFERRMKCRSAHMYNMFIMRKRIADNYCQFLFDILEKLEERIDITDYDSFQKRVYGRISELLLDVWIEYHDYRFMELPVWYTEGDHILKKGKRYLKSIFTREKYTALE